MMLKELWNWYYENTVIPAIVLGCLTSLGQYFIHWMTEGIAYATAGEIIFAFVFFLVIMTAEDLWKGFRKLMAALEQVG